MTALSLLKCGRRMCYLELRDKEILTLILVLIFDIDKVSPLDFKLGIQRICFSWSVDTIFRSIASLFSWQGSTVCFHPPCKRQLEKKGRPGLACQHLASLPCMTPERKQGERKELSLKGRTQKMFFQTMVIYFGVFQKVLPNYPHQNDLKSLLTMQIARPPHLL